MEKVFQRFYDAKRAELRAQGSALASNKSVATEKPDNISVTAGKPGNTSVVTEQPRDTTDVTEKLGDISGTAESPANVSQSESPPLFVTQISNSCATPGSSHDEFPSPSKVHLPNETTRNATPQRRANEFEIESESRTQCGNHRESVRHFSFDEPKPKRQRRSQAYPRE